jgi:hypothetical protein
MYRRSMPFAATRSRDSCRRSTSRTRIDWRAASGGIVHGDGGRWAPDRQRHCSHRHGREQPNIEPGDTWFHCSIKSTLAASRTVRARDRAVLHRAGLPSTVDRRGGKTRYTHRSLQTYASLRSSSADRPPGSGWALHQPRVLPERVLDRWMARRSPWRP